MDGIAFHLKTGPAEELFKVILSWLTRGNKGGMITGLPRLGKTCAVKWCVKAIGKFYGCSIPYLHVPMRLQEFAGEKDFFQHILVVGKHRDAMKGTRYEKRDRLSEMLILMAQRCPLRMVVISFDEAQSFKLMHWQWILNISNEAIEKKIRVFFIFLGQPELLAAKQKLIDGSQGQIVDRFLSSETTFSGIESLDDFRICLKGFNDVIYPVRERQPLVAHFVSDPSFRLEDYAETMWNIFQEIWIEGRNDHSESTTVPMHHVAAATTQFLTALSNSVEDIKTAAAELAAIAVEDCGYKEFVIMKNRMGFQIDYAATEGSK
ncbi:ATP-binding protein [Variovorax sp. GT1P44]|uniref:ATP-binding protein n=1 Tax=Variovorax sp. GT1P44 TaxID=3443742 RepID=UPI003F481C5B